MKSYVGMTQCYFCGGDKNELILDRRLKNSLPRRACYDHEPCDTCKGYMEQGIILISVRDGESGNNPYRTGAMCVVTEDCIKEMVKDKETKASILKKRMCYVPDEAWEGMGLPKVKE